ncbi:hypothetical protein BRC96_02355 [Halobacteriales archaeon QS_6_64_34]|nr:MAG: hypothetical protein BRC96_02355 [Halobacteriales archaeon QS_6_64_34]
MKEQFSYRARKWILQHVSSDRHATQHERIADTDWDILVILDACSAAALKEAAKWPVETVVSPASCTPEWLKKAEEADILDSRIVSANPQYEKFDIEIEPYYRSHWNDELSTVLPEPILDRTDELVSEDVSVIAHLQQPHWPYIAKFGDSWKKAYSDLGPWETGEGKIDSTQVAMARGRVDINKARQAYYASVHSIWSTVLPYVTKWINRSFKTVITADHGETFGRFKDMKFYEHPCKCHISPLTNVPWVEIGPEYASAAEDGTVEERLKALGYAE